MKNSPSKPNVPRTSIALLVGVLAAGIARAGETQAPASAESQQPAGRSLHFVNDVLPVLTRYGCNSGGCHGRAVGQNGFKLSLFGFDPAADFAAIAEDGLARRVSWTAPDESLVLRKPSGQVPHGGGVRFELSSPAYRLVSEWIAEGTPWGDDNAPTLAAIEVDPVERMAAAGQTGNMRVVAKFSEGSRRDVSETAEFFNQSPAQLAVSPAGEIRVLETPGEGTIAVRYQGIVAISRWMVPYRADPPADFYAGFTPVNFVDQFVLDRWRKLGLAPSPPSTDAEFVRRAFLDVIGTLPAPQEIREFLADSAPDKRERLIDRLLERPEYAIFWAQKWGDILRNRQGDAAQKDNSLKFNEWLRSSLAANMPYDKFARDADRRHRQDRRAAANGLVPAAQFPTEPRRGHVPGLSRHAQSLRQLPQSSLRTHLAGRLLAFRSLFCPCRCHELWDGENSRPERRRGRFQSEVRAGNDACAAFGGPEVPYVKGEDARQKLVDWMTAKENPYFARTLVNRLWGHYLKRGLVEPVDDQRATNPATNPALLHALAKDFADSGYDVKRLTRTILRSRVYGLSSAPRPENSADRQNFARYYPQRLAPHVLLDAIDAATGHKTKFQQFADITRAIQLPNESEPNDFLDIFGRSKRDTPCVCETRLEPNLSQVLFLLFSPEVQQALAHPEGLVSQMVKAE